jgi:hypothetical protein
METKMGRNGDIFGGQWRQKWVAMETFLGVNGDKNGSQWRHFWGSMEAKMGRNRDIFGGQMETIKKNVAFSTHFCLHSQNFYFSLPNNSKIGSKE